jgi:DNA-binding SARP family transcriptional activator/WD40 repeat protein
VGVDTLAPMSGHLAVQPTGRGYGAYFEDMDVRVLGPVEVHVDGTPVGLGGDKQRGLLGLLIAAAPQVVSVDALIQGLWGPDASTASKSTLQTHVWNLRRIVGDVLVHDRGGYRLDIDPAAIDAVRFVTTLADARRDIATDPGETAARLRGALGDWRGLAYADLVGIPGLEAEARRLEELRLEAVELRIDAELASGHHAELIAELDALAEAHPTRERFRAQHMLALYRSGRQAEALRAFRRTEQYLADELGVEPSEELRELELKVLQHDASLLGGSGRAVTQRLAFLVTDIEGSTLLWDRFPQAMASALAAHDRLLAEAIEGAGGRVFKHTGDGVLAVFTDTGGAVKAAEVAQHALAATRWEQIGELRVRMGVDVGEAESRGEDFYGPPLNRAARLCAVAHGGQVLMSAAAHSELTSSSPAGVQVRQLGEVHLKGIATPERVAQLVFVGLPADFPDLRTDTGGVLDDRDTLLALPGYEVRERIGEGAFGIVWRGYQPSVGREVAIKAIHPELASRPSFVRRFEAEARTIARLAHPHIVPLIDFWRDTDGAYLVLAILPGGSLAQALEAGTVDQAAARRILAQVGAALDHSHSQGLAHGDLKPSNVLLDGAGNAYLTDFGIASRLLDVETVSSMSSDPRYRAPEVDRTGSSPPADIYSLGMLAAAVLEDDPGIEAVLARATAPNPADRHTSAASFLAELDEVLGEGSTQVERPAVSRNPYKGLRAFDEGDALDFRGRAALLATLVEAVASHRFVTVVGPSGSGKSSVVRAGLLPQLAAGAVGGSESWYRVVLTPGAHPVQSLTEALEKIAPLGIDLGRLAGEGGDLAELIDSLGADGEVLLVVDQFEELFAVDDPGRRRRFVDLLLDAVEAPNSGVRVVATLRADFYDRPLEDPRLGRLVRDGLVTVLPPTRDELVEMIAAPAHAVGLRWEPGLPYRIAEDVAHLAGGLPLLQYALTELVERRSADLLTDSDYTRIGGVAGALASRAEALYRDLTPSQQEAVRNVMLRLVAVDEDSDDLRRRVRRSELESLGIPRADLEAVLDAFTSNRLLLADRDPATRGPTVEVAHEALLRDWPRLQGWIEDQRESLILGRRFRAAMAEWEANGRHVDYLLTGSRLAPFVGWADTSPLPADEHAYFRASKERDDAERRARRRRRRTLTGVLAAAAVVASVFGVVALVQADRAGSEAELARHAEELARQAEERAEEEADRAQIAAERAEEEAGNARRAERLATARELAAFSIVEDDPELSLLLGMHALELAPDDEDIFPRRFFTAFREAVHASRTILHLTWDAAGEPVRHSGDISPDGRRLVLTTAAYTVEVRDARTGEFEWSLSDPAQGGLFSYPQFSPDGALVAVAFTRYWSEERRVEGGLATGIHLLAAATGETVSVLGPPTVCEWVGLPRRQAFTPDGGSLIRLIDPPGEDPVDGCFDGHLEVEIVDLATGEPTHRVAALASQPEGSPVWVAAGVDSTGSVLVISDQDDGGPTRAFSLDTGELAWQATATVDTTLSADGSLAVAAIGGVAQLSIDLVDPSSGEVLVEIEDERSYAVDLVLSADGSRLYAGRADGSIAVWDTSTATLLREILSPGDLARLAVDDSGSTLLAVGPDTARTLDITNRRQGEVMAYDFSPFQVAFSALAAAPDFVAVMGFHGRCPTQYGESLLLDPWTGEVIDRFYDVGGNTLALTRDGTRLLYQVSAPDDPDVPCDERSFGSIVVKETATMAIRTEFEGLCAWDNADDDLPPECLDPPDHPYAQFVSRISVSTDGQLAAAVGYATNALSVWETATGAVLLTRPALEGECCVHDIAIHPDGSGVAVTTMDWSRNLPRLRVFDLDGEVVHEEDVFALPLDFSPDGRMLAVGTAENMLLVFETDEWSRWEVDAHRDLTHVAFSPNGRLVMTAGSEGVIKVWDVDARELVHEIGLGFDFAKAVAFVDDLHIAVGTQHGLVAVFTLDFEELVEIARSRVGRTFTQHECQTYLHVETCPDLAQTEEVATSRPELTLGRLSLPADRPAPW